MLAIILLVLIIVIVINIHLVDLGYRQGGTLSNYDV